MKQSGNSINPANADEVLTSSKDALQKGQQQFFTPENFAAAVLTPITPGQTSIYDPQCGSLALLKAAERKLAPRTNHHLLGTDVDARSKAPSDHRKWSIHSHTDVTALAPLLRDTQARFGNILTNPPFSLRWSASPIIAALSDHPDHAALHDWARNHIDSSGCIDSTLWTILFSLAFMDQRNGESMVICNDNTASRLLADQNGLPTVLSKYCFLHLTVTAPVFPDIHNDFPTGVLYLSASHGRGNYKESQPLHLTCHSNHHDEIHSLLSSFNKRNHHHGYYLAAYDSPYYELQNFTAAITELKASAKEKSKFNISLDPRGRISVYLSTYATIKFNNTDHEALRRLNTLRGQHPASLVVQAPTRRALQYAVSSGIWTVDPAVHSAVDRAIGDYNAVRAPFYRLSPVQSLGYLDEEETILCTSSLAPHYLKGKSYPLNCYTEKIQTDGEKWNLAGEKEQITLHSQELVVRIKGEEDVSCTFHVNESSEPNRYTIGQLVNHFQVPTPPDIATTNPELHQQLTRKLALIQDHINLPTA